jgi:hypothetical protein
MRDPAVRKIMDSAPGGGAWLRHENGTIGTTRMIFRRKPSGRALVR